MNFQKSNKIYQLLKEKKLLSKKSIKDFIHYLSDIRIVNINGKWVMETMPKAQADMLAKLKLSIK